MMVVQTNLSRCSKICFAIGGIPYQLTGCVIGFFLQVYLLSVAHLTPSEVAIVLFSGRAWDAITDPIVGWCVAQTPTTKYGKIMPWIIISAPLAAMSYIAMWTVPPFENKLPWYIITYCLFQMLQTCFYIPYSSLTLSLSHRQEDRDSATAYRMTAEVFGMMIGAIIQGVIVGGDIKCDINANETVSGLSYVYAATASAVVYILCALILFVGVKDINAGTQLPNPTLKGYKLIITFKPYIVLIIGFLFTSMAFMLLQGNIALFLSQTMRFKDNYQQIILVVIFSAVLAVPFWQWFLGRYGKKITVYIGMLLVIPFIITLVCIPSNIIIVYFIAVGSGLSIAAAFLLPWSMLPDVIDKFKTCYDTSSDVLFYSFYILFTKMATGVAMAMSTLSLEAAGYISGGCTQPEKVNVVLRILLSIIPIIFIIIGLLVISFYNDKKCESEII